MATERREVLQTRMSSLTRADSQELDESIWLLGSKNATRYDYDIFSREEDEHSVKQAKVFIDDAINYRSIMHSIDPLALKLYRIYFSRPIRIFYFVVVTVLLGLAFFEFKSTLSFTSDTLTKGVTRIDLPCGLTEFIELVCFAFFVADIILQWRLTGTKRFIRRPWSLIYLGTVLFSVVDLFGSFGFCLGGGYTVYPYRIRRLLRPLIFLQSSSVMKKMVNALKKTLPGILSVLFLLAMHLYLYAIIGMLIFQTYCKEENEQLYNCTKPKKFRQHEACDLGNTTNSTEGFKYFDDLGEGIINMIVLLTTANHPDIMMPAYRQHRLYSLYFISFLVIGLYILMNVLTAVVYNQFRGFLATSVQSSFTRRRVAQFAAFVILANRTSQVKKNRGNKLAVSKSYVRLLLQEIKLKKNILGLISEKLELLNDDMLTWSQFKGIFVALRGRQKRYREERVFQYSTYRWVAWIQLVLLHKFSTYFSILITVLNCLVISLMVIFRCDLDYPDPHPNYILGVIDLLFLPYYVVECIVYIVFLRKHFFVQIRHWYDLVSALLIIAGDVALMCVLKTFDANVYVGTVYKEAKIIIQVTHIFVMLRLLRIIPHISALRHIANTILHLIRNLRAYVGLLICIYYFFAILGMMIFNGVEFPEPHERNEFGVRYGEICGTYEQARYYPNNFNDFGSSLVVLYDVMVVNNWYMFLHAYGRVKPFSQLYFIVWWLIASVVGLSLLVALLLEAFITKWEAAKVSSSEGTDSARSRDIEDMDFDGMLEEEDVVDLLKGELKEPEDEELIREILAHDDIKLRS